MLIGVASGHDIGALRTLSQRECQLRVTMEPMLPQFASSARGNVVKLAQMWLITHPWLLKPPVAEGPGPLIRQVSSSANRRTADTIWLAGPPRHPA